MTTEVEEQHEEQIHNHRAVRPAESDTQLVLRAVAMAAVAGGVAYLLATFYLPWGAQRWIWVTWAAAVAVHYTARRGHRR